MDLKKRILLGVLIPCTMLVHTNITYGKIMVENISYVCQMPNLPTGCEVTALEILMRQSGFKVTKEELAKNISKASVPKWSSNGVAYGEHPDDYFLGDPFKDKSFGVYSQGIINLMTQYMSRHRIQDLTGSNFSEIEKIVSTGRPVMVWSTLNQVEPKYGGTWITPSGDEFTWKKGEHALVVIGFNNEYVWTSDPAKGVLRKYPKTRFIDLYNKMGKQAIAIYDKEQEFYSKKIKINNIIVDDKALIGKDLRVWIPVRVVSKMVNNLTIDFINDEVILDTSYNNEKVRITHKNNQTFKDGKPYDIGMMQNGGTTYIDTKWLSNFYSTINVKNDKRLIELYQQQQKR